MSWTFSNPISAVESDTPHPLKIIWYNRWLNADRLG